MTQSSSGPKTVDGFRNLILAGVVEYRNKRKESHVSNIPCEQIWKRYGQAGPMFCNREQIDTFHEALSQLDREGLLKAVWNDRTGVFTKVRVSKEQAERIFRAQAILSKSEFYDRLQVVLLEELERFPCRPVMALAKADAAGFVREHFRYKAVKEDELNAQKAAMRTLIRVVAAVYENEEDVLERNLSVRLKLGSKGFSNLYKQKVVKILAPADVADDVPANEILKEYHVLQNPPSVGLRGDAVIQMKNGDRLTLVHYNGAIYLEEDFVSQIHKVRTENLYSVENLTTFNSLPFHAQGLVVFTSGYPCSLVTAFMEKVVQDNQLQSAFHCGDMDAYGFRILRDIDAKVSAKVQSFRMGIDDYFAHKDQAIPMSVRNRKSFLEMLNDSYYSKEQKELFQLLLKDGLTLEQESLSVQLEH